MIINHAITNPLFYQNEKKNRANLIKNDSNIKMYSNLKWRR